MIALILYYSVRVLNKTDQVMHVEEHSSDPLVIEFIVRDINTSVLLTIERYTVE